MKKFLKALKMLIWFTSTSLALYWLLHYYATLERGGLHAQGGELLAPVAVLVVYIEWISVRDMILARLLELEEIKKSASTDTL